MRITTIDNDKKKRSIDDSLKTLNKRWKDDDNSDEKSKAIIKDFGRIIVTLSPSVDKSEKTIEDIL